MTDATSDSCPECGAERTATEPQPDSSLVWREWACGSDGWEGEAMDRTDECRVRAVAASGVGEVVVEVNFGAPAWSDAALIVDAEGGREIRRAIDGSLIGVIPS